MKYKLICVDMDGTLLNSRHKISDISKDALKRTHDMGVHIVISTGRSYVDAEAYSNLIGVTSPVIACNGAIVREKVSDDVIHKSVIKDSVCIHLLRIFKQNNVKPSYVTPDKVYCSSLKTKIVVEYLKIRGIMNKSIKLVYVTTWSQWFNIFEIEKDNIIKCEITAINKDKMNNLRKQLESFKEIEISSSSEYNIEITKKGTSKGKAIEILADYYKIRKEEIIAIGDSENDLSAIEFAGLGIAMGNASEEVKRKSDYITDTNDNDGIAKAMDKFILSESK